MPSGMKAFDIEFSDAALLKRPQHAAALGRIFTGWSLIEAAVAGILGHLMHDNQRAAIALLGQFSTNNARLEAVKKVATELVDAGELPAFLALMGRVKIHAKKRNDIAHGVWGVKEGAEHLVYRLSLKDFANVTLEFIPEMKAGNHIGPFADLMEKAEEFTLEALEKTEAEGSALLAELYGDLNQRIKAAAQA